MNSIPEQYRVADFIDWFEQKRLVLNPDFQRRSVWTPDGKTFFIDTMLRQFPIPKVYMRTKIDIISQKSVREVVDGQQRVRTILDFARGHFRLNGRAKEFAGLTYNDLDDDAKERFLSYAISVEQLINASDDDVLQVFARLNSYTVPVNGQELRNAKYQGEFKWKVRDLASKLGSFFERHSILSKRDRLRMLDDEFTAELVGVLREGVCNGGQPNINKLYDRYDKAFDESDEVARKVEQVVTFLDENLGEALQGDVFSRAPQFLVLFAVIAHATFGIPEGDIRKEMPTRDPQGAIDVQMLSANLAEISQAVADNSNSPRFADFVRASLASTQRIVSRRMRFLYLWRALTEVI